MVEYLDVVNEKNEVVDKIEHSEVYDKKLTHRIVHVFVINPKTNDIYLQKRSEKKPYLPGFYCTSAGGHVQSGESYEQAAKRELKEEIGLSVPIKKVAELEFVSEEHKRFIQLFLGYAGGGFNFSDGEVASGEFLTMEDAKSLIEKGDEIHPQLKFCFDWYLKNFN